MTGRTSVEQAKAIEAGRGFVQELEDIKNFGKKVVGGSEGCSSMKRLSAGKRGVTSNKPHKKCVMHGFRVF